MAPHDLSRRKRTSGSTTFAGVEGLMSQGILPDYSVNVMQLNDGTIGNGNVSFSDIAGLAGVAATDWSWSPLLADFDNDGNKDLFIGNGYPKAVNDLDYMTAAFSARRRSTEREGRRAALDMLARLPAYEGVG